jgi:hypothetical protein
MVEDVRASVWIEQGGELGCVGHQSGVNFSLDIKIHHLTRTKKSIAQYTVSKTLSSSRDTCLRVGIIRVEKGVLGVHSNGATALGTSAATVCREGIGNNGGH